MKYTPEVDSVHPFGSGRQRIYRFTNGYGASVVRFAMPESGFARSMSTLTKALVDNSNDTTFGSYTDNNSEWEVAVIVYGADGGWRLTYETPITDDVIGHVHDDNLEALLDRIAALPASKDKP